MKQVIILALMTLILSCTGRGEKKTEQVNILEKGKSPTTMDPQIDNDQLIIPGKSIGKIFLEQDMQDVFKILGKADDGDAAMGKAWGIWHLTDSSNPLENGDLSIYSSYRDTTMTIKEVKQVVISAINYSTGNGVHNGSSLNTIRSAFPEIQKAGTYVKDKDTLVVYDAINEGIAFDIRKSGQQLFSMAITVHPQKQLVNSTYLTIHPGWKQIIK